MKCLKNMREWCSEMSCREGREAAVTTTWRWVSRLYRCVHKLTARSKQRIAEWLEIANSVSKPNKCLLKIHNFVINNPDKMEENKLWRISDGI